MVQLAAVVQSAPANEYGGRVSSVMGSASAAAVPIGSLAGGTVAASFGPRVGMAGFGVGVLLLATSVLAHPSLRALSSPTRVSLSRTHRHPLEIKGSPASGTVRGTSGHPPDPFPSNVRSSRRDRKVVCNYLESPCSGRSRSSARSFANARRRWKWSVEELIRIESASSSAVLSRGHSK